MLLLVASETGHVYTFATRKLQPMITSETGKALIQTCLNSPDSPPRSDPTTDQRMSATGFEETDLTYQVSESDSSGETKVSGPPRAPALKGFGFGAGSPRPPSPGATEGGGGSSRRGGGQGQGQGAGVRARRPDRRPAEISGRPPCPYKACSGSARPPAWQAARIPAASCLPAGGGGQPSPPLPSPLCPALPCPPLPSCPRGVAGAA